MTSRKNQRVAPGYKAYPSATKYGKKIVVIRDSHLKKKKRNLFKSSFDNAKSFIKSFAGEKSQQMKFYVALSLK